ncbi:putative ABC transporter [Aureobasidium subglaciale]|nr:putative ABC transporter [Aureobasidium subglaciale]
MTATTLLSCAVGCSDDSFGPASCARSFDFTLTFEQSILSILPSALLLLAVPPRLFLLSKRQSSTDGYRKFAFKAVGSRIFAALVHIKCILAATNAALQLSLLVLWSSSSRIQIPTSVPSTALSFIDSVMILCLSYFEEAKSIRPSSLLSVYLLLSVVFDAAQVRTLWLTNRTNVAAVQTASIAVRTILLFLEAQSKTSYLKLPFKDYPPEAKSGILNLSFVWWLNQLFAKGFRKLITTEDLFALDHTLRSEAVGRRLQVNWDRRASRARSALPKAVLVSLEWDLLLAVFPRLCLVGFTFAQPFLITSAINYVDGPASASNTNLAYGLLGATFLIYLGISVSSVHYKQYFARVVVIFRGSMISLIYNQTLTFRDGLSAESAALTLMSTGNACPSIVSNDINLDNIVGFLENIYDMWARVLEISVGTWLLERQLGATCVVPLIVVLGMSILLRGTGLLRSCVGGQTLVAKTIGKDQQNWNQAIQTRVKNTSNTLGSMKAIKISGYADALRSNLQDERRRELELSGPFFMGIIAGLPTIWSPVITFMVFAIQASLRGQESLTTAQTFTSLSLITLVTSPAAKLLALLPQIAAAFGCFERIQTYLLSEKRADNRKRLSTKSSITLATDKTQEPEAFELTMIQPAPSPDINAVRFDNVTISVTSEVITKATFDIPKGSFTVIIGPVGSGKTTLLKAILGELPCQSGSVSIFSNSMSYCSQASFVLNGSVKENICGPLGAESIDEKWYATVMNACDLDMDVQRWSNRDDTVVGSKGLKLSGGQKQRLALARAVYARRDLVLLDDTMSALDNKTHETITRQLFSRTGVLRQLGTTVVLTSHSTRILRLADQIIVLDREGNITLHESYESLRGEDPSNAATSIQPHEMKDNSSSMEDLHSEESTSKTSGNAAPDNDLMDLTRRTGDLKLYSYYLQIIGWPLSLIFLIANVAAAFTDNFPQVWLKWWAADDVGQLSKYLPVYVALALAATISASVCIWVVFLRIMPKSAAMLHAKLLDTVISAPLSFFASTDSGVTLNRFSQDMSLVDLALPIALLSLVMACFDCIAKVGLIATGSSYMAISIPFTIITIFFIQHVYLKTSRQLRYLDLENKSPLYSHYTETLEGLATFRAFGWELNVMEIQAKYLDNSQIPYYMLLCVQRWLNLVLDLLVTALAITVVALAVNLRTTTNAGLLGIALNNILSFNKALSSVVTSWTSLETSLGAIARVKTFTTSTPSENKPNEDQSCPPGWPGSGAVELREVSVKYDDGSVALDNISMTIAPGQKIGICGRSGSGKSSLISAILRLVSVSTGTIMIDGIDIHTLRPDTLRQSLIAVPQDSLTLSGTVRSNIDPLSVASDTAITSALEKVGIWAVLESRGGLEATLLDQPLSQGEQQLIGLARVMLRTGRVLILDEATSSVDDETDQMVQRVIAEEFAEYTVITVAHRLETILSSDKIAVLDAGKMVEFDSPENLLATDGMFRQLYRS